MFELVLYEPEIPPNTGNIIRLCANAGARLHLVGRLGFELDDRRLRRAGLDYHEYATLHRHDDLEAFLSVIRPERLFALTTRGQRRYDTVDYRPGDALLLGPETRGLPAEVLASIPGMDQLHVPMRPGNRSLNLSNTAAIVLYEAWRQQGFSMGSVEGRVPGEP